MEMIGPALALGFVLRHIVDWLRTLIPDDYEAKVLIPATWVLAIGGAWLLSTSEYLGSRIEVFPDLPLYHADPVAIGLYGFATAAVAALAHDAVKPHTPPHDGT